MTPRPPLAVTGPARLERGPLTPTQMQMWALDRRKPPPAALNLSYALSIRGPLHTGALSAAFHDLIGDHEPLRTVYPEVNGSPLAVVAEEETALGQLSLSPGRAASPAEAAQRALADRCRGFSLGQEAPIRAELLRLAGDWHVLLLTLHHIAADAWSLHVLSQQLSRGYSARLRNEPSPSGRPAVNCTEHARRQHDWLTSPAAEQELSWWLARLHSATARPWAPGAPRQEVSADLVQQVMPLPDQLTAELRRLARQSGMSLFVVLLTAFQALVKVWLGLSEPVIGTLAANRPTAASSQLLGAHYNTLFLNTDLGGDPSLTECLLRTAAGTVSALDHQSLPGAVLARHLERELGWDPGGVPGLMFLLDRYPLDSLRLEGCKVTGLYLGDGRLPGDGPSARVPAVTTADLIFAVRDTADHLTLSALHWQEMLDEPSVASAMGSYLELLIAMCDSPELSLSELALPLGERLPPVTTRPVGPAALALHEVTQLAPVDAVSPVGVWTRAQSGCQEGGAS